VIPGAFAYHRPGSLAEAVRLLAELGDDARPLAGGHSLIPLMKLRLAQPEHLVDLSRLDDLRGIAVTPTEISLGAMVTQAELIAAAAVAEACPLLREAAQVIADPQVRYVGTLGGNVANGDPGNDLPAVMQCLDAVYVLQGPAGERTVAARAFYQASYVTALQPGELLVAIRIPRPAAGHGFAYEKLKRKVGDYATAAAAVVLTMAAGRCTSAAIGLTNVGPTPMFAAAASQSLVGTAADDAAIAQAAELAARITAPADDGRGPPEYRTRMAAVMTVRALRRARDRAVP
jgi:carbon-monoxide dehydrogenase medium subunit